MPVLEEVIGDFFEKVEFNGTPKAVGKGGKSFSLHFIGKFSKWSIKTIFIELAKVFQNLLMRFHLGLPKSITHSFIFW